MKQTHDPADPGALFAYLRNRRLTQSGDGQVLQVPGGRSNLTYMVRTDGHSWVLRRPPPGEILATAHDVGREYVVISALAGTDVPVPRTVHLCRDAAILGAPFYLMEYVDGSVLRTIGDYLALPVSKRAAVSRHLVDCLIALHQVDHASVGLQEFGRPEGFMTRQVGRWTRQLAATQQPTSQMERLASHLADDVPQSNRVAVLHGDYRLDNCIIAGDTVAAILDWEMSTVGDPLADLAMFLVYHYGFCDLPNPVIESPGAVAGSLPESETIALYCEGTGIEIDGLSWYLAFAWFKLAVILAGVSHRSAAGQVEGDQFEGVSSLVDPCIERGLDALRSQ